MPRGSRSCRRRKGSPDVEVPQEVSYELGFVRDVAHVGGGAALSLSVSVKGLKEAFRA